MAINGTGAKDDPVIVTELAADEVPGELRPSNFFDLDRYPFEHRALIDGARSVVDLIGKDGIERYATEWLAEKIGSAEGVEERTGLSGIGNYTALVEPGAVCEPLFVHGSLDGEGHTLYVARDAKVVGAVIYLDGGDIYVGEGAVVEPTAGVKGPTIIGPNNEIRQGAYLRGNIILGGHKKQGDNAIRGEIKNVLMLDEANFPHPSYLGDSLCGYATHFGNQATAANLGIIQGVRERDKRVNLKVVINDKWYDLGGSKMGVVLGDRTQLACESLTDPGTLLGPMCISYGLAYVKAGYYPAGTMFKTRSERVVDTQKGIFDPDKL